MTEFGWKIVQNPEKAPSTLIFYIIMLDVIKIDFLRKADNNNNIEIMNI